MPIGIGSQAGRARRGSAVTLLVALTAIVCAAALTSPQAARADDEVEYFAAVDRDSIGLDEIVLLTVTLGLKGNTEPSSLELPRTPDFDVISQGSSTQMSIGFGSGGSGFQKTRTYTLQLRPTREGALEILPGVAMMKGKRYETGRIVVQVGRPGSGAPRAQRPQPRPGWPSPFGGALPGLDDDFDPFGMLDDRAAPAESDLVLRASVNKREVYVGEQLTLSIYLMARSEVSGIESFQMPDLDGFWNEEIETPTQVKGETRVIDGVAWRVYLLRRRALFPLRDGSLEIQPAEVDVITGGGLFGRSRRGAHHRRSQPASVTVKPLPTEAGMRADASRVGSWKLEVEAEPRTAALGAPITVRLRATGNGNLRNLELPRLPAIEGMKIFDPTQTDRVDTSAGRYGGSRVQEYVLVPERAGRFTIPSLELPHFDPGAGAYRKASTQPISLLIRPGSGSSAPAVAQTQPGTPADSDGGLAGIRQATRIEARTLPLHARPWFAVALGLPGLALLGAALLPRIATARGRGAGERQRRGAGTVARKRLAAARALALRRDPAFYEELDRAIHDYLGNKLAHPTAGLVRAQLVEELAALGATEESREALRRALDACDAGRFAPAAMDSEAASRALRDAGLVIDGIEASLAGGGS